MRHGLVGGFRQRNQRLLQAFAKDVVHNIRLEPLRELLDEYIVTRFHE